MKRAWCLIPTILALSALLFILFLSGNASRQLDDYLISVVIISVFGISDWLFLIRRWYGGIPGALFGLNIIVYGSQFHGQVFDERPVGALILAYYLLHAAIIRITCRAKN